MTSEQQVKTDNRPRPTTEQFRAFVREGWAPRPDLRPARAEVSPYAAARREALSAAYPGERLVIPAGGLSWDDHINLPEAGNYTLRLVICFDGAACQQQKGTWHTLSPEIPVTIR